MKDYIVAGSLMLAFVLTLAALVLMRIQGTDANPLDELLLILGGGIAGATIPKKIG